MSNAMATLKSQLHPEDRVRLAEIMARNNLRDDDAILLAIAECLAIASGGRHLRDELRTLTESATETTRHCNNAARNTVMALNAIQHLLSDPQTMKNAAILIEEAHAQLKKEIDRLKTTMVQAVLPRWAFAAAAFVGALAISVPILWRIEDLRRHDTIIMASQGGRIDQCTIPKGMPVRHDPAVGRYIVCAEREPLQ